MTVAEELIQKGVEKGMEQGIEQGIRKGIRKGLAEAGRLHIRKILAMRFGELPSEVELSLQQVSKAKELEQLLEWALQCPDLRTFLRPTN